MQKWRLRLDKEILSAASEASGHAVLADGGSNVCTASGCTCPSVCLHDCPTREPVDDHALIELGDCRE